ATAQSGTRTTSIRTAGTATSAHGAQGAPTARRPVGIGGLGDEDPAGGGGQPQVDGAGAGGVASAVDGHPDLAGPEVAVAGLDALPAGADDAQLHGGRLGPAAAEGDEDGAALAHPGDEAAGRGGRDAPVGGDDDAVEPVDEGGGDAPPLTALGGGDEHDAVARHAELR